MANILLIEDDENHVYLISRALSRHGHTVDTTLDMYNLVNVIRTLKPDLIMTDLNMPMMTGRTVMSVIRAESDLIHIPVIAITAVDAQFLSDEHEIFDGVLSKSLTLEELCKRVNSFLDLSTEF